MSKHASRTLMIVLLAMFALSAAGCRASGVPEPSPNTPTSAGLVEEPTRYDGTAVTFRGEVIGEAMTRGETAWLHINDDAYYKTNVEEGADLGGYNSGMPVWLSAEDAALVSYFGDYKHEGDIVEVKGVFNAACAEHGGDMDIHATAMTVIEAGHEVTDPIHPEKVLWAAALALLAMGVYLLDRYWDRLTESRTR